MRVLVVEDEVELAEALGVGLRREGYAVDVAFDARAALERFAVAPYDLVLLDLNLPDGDGLTVCADMRRAGGPQPRVLMLTARDSLEDRVRGLDEGADDYLVKPFAFPELLARVRALLRRDADATRAVVEAGPVRLDAAARTVTVSGEPLALTAKEFALLRYMMLHPGEALSTEQLLDHVWDEHADPFTNTVRVTVSNLRRKLRDAGVDGIIETVVGFGYRLEAVS